MRKEVLVGGAKPFGKRGIADRMNTIPVIVASLVVMNKAMVPRVMSDVVVQRGVPFLGSCCAAPSGVSEPNQSKEHGLSP